MMRRVGGWAAGRAAPWILPAQRSAAARGTVGVPSVASASRPSAPLGMGVMRSYCDEEELSPFAEKVIKAETLPDGRFKFYFDKDFQTHRCEGPANFCITTAEELLWLYENMYRCRRVEMAADGLYKQRAVRGFLHLVNGQEAIQYGLERAVTMKDHIITAYRDHAAALTRGWTPRQVLAELCGKATGGSKGKGGSMHMYSAANNFYGGNGIVGAQCPVGAGLAFAAKYLKTGAVAFALYGDGAANQGQLYEAFNMATIWRLPVIFCCENNRYGMGTSVERASATLEWFTRGDYIPGVKVDGMDALAVKVASAYAAEHARSGRGPMVLEYETYRYMGHSMSDPGTSYRTREEINEVRARRDPIERIKARLLINKIATSEQIKDIEKAVRNEVDAATEQVKKDPFPELPEAYHEIYAEDVEVRGRSLFENYAPAH